MSRKNKHVFMRRIGVTKKNCCNHNHDIADYHIAVLINSGSYKNSVSIEMKNKKEQ